MECPSCGATVPRGMELCPECGRPLHTGVCTYCGAAMDADDQFCPECGGPRQGIQCPKCGTLNFRSFCRSCHTPLDELAAEEMERARKDPVFIRMVQLGQRMAELESRLINAARAGSKAKEEEPVADFSQAAELTAEEKELVAQYKQMMEQLGLPPVEPPKAEPPKAKTETKERQKLNVGGSEEDLEALKAEYAQNLQEMNDLMSQLIPDPGTSPQIQRNYYSARKLPVFTTEIVSQGTYWVCNECQVRHRQPEECAFEKLGGNWIYETIEVTTKTYV